MSRRARGTKRRSLTIPIVIMMVVVGILVAYLIYSQTAGNPTDPLIGTPVPQSVMNEISGVSFGTLNTIGVGGSTTGPTAISASSALTLNGKPEVLYMGAEYCPYCAAERWAIVTSLSRFGTFSGLETMQSSPLDVYPRTQTFTFKTATYTSPYVGAQLLEIYGQDKATGSHPVLKKPSKAQIRIMKKYDAGSTTRSGTIPFMDIGNKIFFSGATFNPDPMQTLSRTTIAASLKNPHNAVTKLILGASNFISASICNVDGGKPGAVCSSSGVKAAAKAIKIST